MSDSNEEHLLEWNVTIEYGEKVWRALVNEWISAAPWPWTMAEIRPWFSTYEAHLTDTDYVHDSWIGFFDTVENAKRAIAASLHAMRTSSAVVCIDDRGIAAAIRVTLRVHSTAANIAGRVIPKSG